jgi:hypothetical protein
MILTLLLTILFLIPNLLSNTKFLNALFSIQPHKLTQPLFSIQPYIPCNNTSPSTKFPKTNFYNTINQNINKPQTTNGSLSPPHAEPLRKPTANILLNIQFQTKFPAETCKTCREYTGKFHLYAPTSTTIQNPHNPAQSSLAHQAESHFLSLYRPQHKNNKIFSVSFAFTSGYKKRRKHKKIKNKFVMLVLNLQQSYHQNITTTRAFYSK